MARLVGKSQAMVDLNKKLLRHDAMLEGIVEKWIDDGLRQIMLSGIDQLRHQYGQRLAALPVLGEAIDHLDEALSSDDWSKWGMVIALMWSKVDSIRALLDQGNKNTQAVTQQLQNIAMQMNTLIQKVK